MTGKHTEIFVFSNSDKPCLVYLLSRAFSHWDLAIYLLMGSVHFASRMLSSRMRTARSLTISHSIRRVGVCPTPPADPPPCGMTHACENITFPQLLLRAVINYKQECISGEFKPPTCWQYWLHEIGRDIDIFLILMWPSPWCVTLTLSMTYSHIQRINML